ncbi:subtilisin-like serine protease [Stylonychia lemnae]|uniref:Subtilisin-like serine protease n=1 Tax=Stylonychia lemnae TaxID=5949 RepID=A0A078AM38_STYLE|nr:subtilisin-like serine protease [Stylonychia lemnae]|eukprot:CDW81888.1 subtilisin-like serine protease [Stylonychia lemnae]
MAAAPITLPGTVRTATAVTTWTTASTGGAPGYRQPTITILVPNGINSNQCRIRVSDYYGTLLGDMSDANFTIAPSNDITVTSPNGGESMVGLSTYTISWTNLPSASGQYYLQYSVDNGSSWTNITSNITGNAYAWSVPNIPSNQCLIKVLDYNNTCKFDERRCSRAAPITLRGTRPHSSRTFVWNTH